MVGTYPKGLQQCIDSAKNSNFKYIAANSQSGAPACTFYNDDGGVIPSTVSAGNVVDTGELHYVMY